MKYLSFSARLLFVSALGLGFTAAPVLRAHASSDDSSFSEREPSSKSKKQKKKKKAKKAAKRAKSKARRAHGSAHSGSHSPKANGPAAGAGASHYPTQPGGSGFADIPNEKKDDLPPPQNAEPKGD